MSNRFFIKLRFKEAAMTDTMAMVMIFEHFLEKTK